jgi:hypothetical protein
VSILADGCANNVEWRLSRDEILFGGLKRW